MMLLKGVGVKERMNMGVWGMGENPFNRSQGS